MIQNYLAEPLVKNYTAPKYPILIALQNTINSIHIKKSVPDVKADILQFAQKIGVEGERFVIACLFESLELPDFKEKSGCPNRIALLTQLITEYARGENFFKYFPEILIKLVRQSKQSVSVLLRSMFEVLKVPITTLAVIGLSLYLSDRKELIEQGEIYLITRLQELRRNDKGSDLSRKIRDEMLFQISRNPELCIKLEEEYSYLLMLSDKDTEDSTSNLYNFLRCDWQHFANESYQVEKPTQALTKKSDYIKELGPCITFQPETLKNVITDLGGLSEEDVFECLVMMTQDQPRTDSGLDRFVAEYLFSNNKKNGKVEELRKTLAVQFNSKKVNGSWNVENFINVCNQICQNLKWQNVFAFFDRPKLLINSEDHFLNIMKAFQRTKKGAAKWRVPENIYLKKWNNLTSQAIFFIYMFSCKDADSLFLHQIQNRRIQKSVKDCNTMQKQIWGHIDLVQLLVEISDYKYISIRELFEIPIAKFPQLLLLTLSEIRPTRGQALLDQLFSNLLPPYLHNHSTSVKLLDTIWESNQDLVISCISEIYKVQSKKENSFNLSRVLDITQTIKDSLIPFTTWNDYQFSIPLAVIAGKRQFLNFEPWVIDRIEKLSNSFVRALLLYVENYLMRNLRTIPTNNNLKENFLQKAQLTIELLRKIFYTIMSRIKREQISTRNFELLKRLFKECCDYFSDITKNQVPDQIERETEREINRIYKEEITIKQAVERFRKLKNSAKTEDQEQFSSNIAFLYSELQFVNAYPEKELMITVELFAGLINAGLFEPKIFAMFLTTLEQGLKEDANKYTFCLKVIQKIKNKLAEQSFFCLRLIDNEPIMRKNPQLVQELVKGLTNMKTPLSEEKQTKIKQAIHFKNAPPAIETSIPPLIVPEEQMAADGGKKIDNNDFEILVALDPTKKIEIPEKQIKLGKIKMICNTLSVSNVDEKSKDLKKLIDADEKVINLLVANIVFKLISITENNRTEMFYKLVEKMPIIEKPVLSTTYKILAAWFAIEGKSINDKKLNNFKNIASWLGKLTIGRGMPIPLHKLNLRRILISSYNHPVRLPFNVPVIIRILQHIHSYPEIFKPTSPWLSRIAGTLTQIEAKIADETLKNQIKAFFKDSKIQKSNQSQSISQGSYLNPSNNNVLNRIEVSELDKYIKIDDELKIKYSNIDLKIIITRAVDDSIQEIVEPVIDRAVKIAKVTTKKLISKDFAYEPDPERLRDSCYNLVKQMAGPLAHVTCRQPLKASMNRNLKFLLQQKLSEESDIENIIQRATADNLDFGCNLIKQAVIESAEEVIKKDPNIAEAIKIRENAKAQGIPFIGQTPDMDIPAIVPEQLRPRKGGLSRQQYEVYSHFERQKHSTSSEKAEERSIVEKVIQLISEKGSVKTIKQLLQRDTCPKEEILYKLHSHLLAEANEESEIEYYLEICEALREEIDPKQCWRSFKQIGDLKKKEIHRIVRKLVRQKYFPESALNELDKTNEEQNKVITLFENWLQTAHEGIEPFLRNLEEMFNKSENQIKMFFSCSLHYVMQKVLDSFSEMHNCYDTNYIENYTKLIIISYKTIASNNCSLYLQHTIQAILDVFNKLQNGTNQFSYQRPFFKLFTNLICDVTRKQYDIDHEKVLTFYCVLAKELQKIGPLSCPSFTYAWMELICNKNFMPALLMRYEYWDLYYHLLCCLLKFVREYITEDNLIGKENSHAYQSFYNGVLKLIIVIVHDFPEFLSEFSLQLALLVSPRFVQLSNIIICAYPKDIIFESPCKIEKKQDLLAQCKKGGMPKYYRLKFDKPNLNYYLQTDPKSPAFRDKLAQEDDQTIQYLVLYASWTSQNQINQAEAMKRLTQILLNVNEDTKQRLVHSILNLVRYPNNVTLFFIDMFKDIIFNKAMKDNATREMILNAIIARMNCEGPQTYGLLYLVLQLQIHSNELASLGVSQKVLELL